MCPRCNVQGMRKVSQSRQNPGRVYVQCWRCDKFFGWADETNPNLERRLLNEIEIMKHEPRELKTMFKIIENGQSILVILEIGVIVLLALILIL